MLHFAILGAGNIAHSLAKTVKGMAEQGEDICLYAVASRDYQRSLDFAQEMGVQKAYGSYAEMLSDPLVDLVYIATPHSHHAEQMKMCIAAGKAILCEKAFTGNAAQAREVIALAEQAGILVTEAIWTRYMPSRRIIEDAIRQGMIGKPCALQANLGYGVTHVPRLIDPALCGGALLDIGIYPLNFADMFFGMDVAKRTSQMTPMPNGLDLTEAITLQYRDGRIADIFASCGMQTDRRGVIYGDQGYLVIDNVNNPHSIELYTKDDSYSQPRKLEIPAQITGYEYQVRSCMKALQEHQLECPEMPHKDTIRMMELMDSIRADWNMFYPFE